MDWKLSFCLFLASASLAPSCGQGDGAIRFGDSSSSANTGIDTRGLIADDLGLHPTADDDRSEEQREREHNGGGNNNNNSGGDGKTEQLTKGDFCCCTSRRRCPQGGFADIVEVDPRSTNESGSDKKKDVTIRIVHDFPDDSRPPANQCPRNQRRCCYHSRQEVLQLGNRCKSERWDLNHCEETGLNPRHASDNGKLCGERSFRHAPGRRHGEASPEEFPWTCLVLDQDNSFIGTCAIIPESFDNDISRDTTRVITAAHKLEAVGKSDLLKIRVREYDASDYQPPERRRHVEYTVTRIRTHPDYVPKRYINDIAILSVDKPINLAADGVNAACLPGCRGMFDYQFQNGTGTRCWVAGWGKDAVDGQFQVVQKKVDVPLYGEARCERKLKRAISESSRSKNRNAGDLFQLHDSEICAGGEKGKDACDGDGGAPLVCQAPTGAWYVVGLVTWGVDCAKRDVPGVYARISHFRDFLDN